MSQTLAVCMIVKNEQAVLARCLKSIKGLYQQLCIVDTGSSDNTIDIAKQYTDDLEVFTDCNDEQGRIIDFAMARNQALQLAKSDWVLQIDADEVLTSGAEQILTHIKNSSIDRVAIAIKNGQQHSLSGRLFRREKARKYQSIIHEYLSFDGVMINDDSIVLDNLSDKTNKETASERNIRLCQLQLAQDAEDSRTWYYLGREYYHLNQHLKAIDCYQKAEQFKRFTFASYQLAYSKAICLFLSKQIPQAIEAIERAIELDDRYAESYCLLADIHFTVSNHRVAQHYYQLALQCTPPKDAYFGIKAWAYDTHPKNQLQKLDKLTNS